MALKEEFEYLAFRCVYCYFLNPARKTRPQAPRLPEFSYERKLRAESRSPGPAPRSGTDTEESAPPSGVVEKEASRAHFQGSVTVSGGFNSGILPLANAPAPWNLVHSFHIRSSPKNPQSRPLQCPDEKEMGEDEASSKEEVLSESQSQEELHQEELLHEEELHEEELYQEELRQEEEEKVVHEEEVEGESNQRHSAPCEAESQSL